MHGTCSSADGSCACDPCFEGDECESANTCSFRGSCSSSTGACVCTTPGYSALSQCRLCDACHAGPTCAASLDVQLCNSPNGACTVNANGSFASCACAPGFSGADCSVVPPPAAAAAGAAGAPDSGSVAAGVLAPLLLAGLAVAALRRRFPGLPLSEAAMRAAGQLAAAVSPPSPLPSAVKAGAVNSTAAAARLAGALSGASASVTSERASLLLAARGGKGAAAKQGGGGL
jgi:hypothetical protein